MGPAGKVSLSCCKVAAWLLWWFCPFSQPLSIHVSPQHIQEASILPWTLHQFPAKPTQGCTRG